MDKPRHAHEMSWIERQDPLARARARMAQRMRDLDAMSPADRRAALAAEAAASARVSALLDAALAAQPLPRPAAPRPAAAVPRRRARAEAPAPALASGGCRWVPVIAWRPLVDQRICPGARVALALLRSLVRQGRPIRRSGLAAVLGVCARTIGRYLSALRMAGYIATRAARDWRGADLGVWVEILAPAVPAWVRPEPGLRPAEPLAPEGRGGGHSCPPSKYQSLSPPISPLGGRADRPPAVPWVAAPA